MHLEQGNQNKMASQSISILIVDDEPVTRRGLQLFVQQLEGIDVLDVARDGEEGIEKALDLHPTVVLMDIGLPGMDGIEAASEIKRLNPQQKVLMLTANESEEAIFAAFNAGADGYVLKTAFANSLELAIRTIKCGSVWFDPLIAQRILSIAMGAQGSNKLNGLTGKDRHMLQDLARESCKDGVCLINPSFIENLKRVRMEQRSTC